MNLFHSAFMGLLNEVHSDKAFEQDSFNCASCELIRCTILAMALPKGVNMIYANSMRGLVIRKIVDFGESKAVLAAILLFSRFFISADAPISGLDHYDLPRLCIPDDTQLSEKSFSWARKCIAKCTRSHEYCYYQKEGRYIPTRLINLRRVGDDYDLRLERHDSIPPGSPYVALSYCWGDFKPACMTTPGTLGQNMESIPWATVPRTFQDAVKFTLSIGIQYLWIDSICIIQKDQRDWQQEAGKMYAVYKNSFLTLAALSGPDSTYGLRTTSVKESSTTIAQLRAAHNNTSCTVYLRGLHYLDSDCGDNHDRASMSYYSLLDRAWAYQERVIPPRMMFFTESEMIYQCLEDVKCECEDARQGMRPTEKLLLKKSQVYLTTSSGSSASPRAMASPDECDSTDRDRAYDVSTNSTGTLGTKDSRASKIAWTWRSEVVPEYSKFKISLSRDRLPALGAIAQQFSNVRPNDDYLAGLWSGSLLQDLLWTCSGSWPANQAPQNHKEKLLRPFNLPTWSWASLQSPIWYHQLEYNVNPKATVVDARCSYVEGNMFGVLEHSRLVLRGRALPCTLEWVKDEVRDRPCGLFYLNGNTRVCLSLHVYNVKMDHDQDGYQNDPSLQEVHILEILTGTRSFSPDRVWKFLILRREGQDENMYTRAGVLTLHYSQGQGSDQSKETPGPDSQNSFESLFESHSVLTTCEIQ